MPRGIYKNRYASSCIVCQKKFESQRIALHCSSICRNVTWRANNRARDIDNKKKWIGRNKERHTLNQNSYKIKRMKKDINYKLRSRLRSRLGRIKYNKSLRTIEWLGCSISNLKLHLESNFELGMTWDNYGEWHIDHIRPLASFDLTDNEQLKIACHYSNLQPLWARINLKKGSTL